MAEGEELHLQLSATEEAVMCSTDKSGVLPDQDVSADGFCYQSLLLQLVHPIVRAALIAGKIEGVRFPEFGTNQEEGFAGQETVLLMLDTLREIVIPPFDPLPDVMTARIHRAQYVLAKLSRKSEDVLLLRGDGLETALTFRTWSGLLDALVSSPYWDTVTAAQLSLSYLTVPPHLCDPVSVVCAAMPPATTISTATSCQCGAGALYRSVTASTTTVLTMTAPLMSAFISAPQLSASPIAFNHVTAASDMLVPPGNLKMPSYCQGKIVKKYDQPDEFETSIGQTLIDLETNSDLKDLRDLCISGAKLIDVGDKKCIALFVPVPLLRQFQRVQQRLVRELEKKFSGKHVVVIAQRRILPKEKPKMKNPLKQKRPRSRTLTSVHNNILEDLVYPAEIVGKRIRVRLDGSRLFKVHLDKSQQTNIEHKVETFSAVYRRLTGKEVTFEFREAYF